MLFQPVNMVIKHIYLYILYTNNKYVLYVLYVYIINIYSKCEKSKLAFCLFGSLISKWFISLNDKIVLGAYQHIYYFSGFGG